MQNSGEILFNFAKILQNFSKGNIMFTQNKIFKKILLNSYSMV